MFAPVRCVIVPWSCRDHAVIESWFFGFFCLKKKILRVKHKMTWLNLNTFCFDLTWGGKNKPKNYLINSFDRIGVYDFWIITYLSCLLVSTYLKMTDKNSFQYYNNYYFLNLLFPIISYNFFFQNFKFLKEKKHDTLTAPSRSQSRYFHCKRFSSLSIYIEANS